MHCKVAGFCNQLTAKDCLKLWPGFKSQYQMRQLACPAPNGLYGQALAAFGAAGRNYGTATAGLHAGKKAVCTRAFDF